MAISGGWRWRWQRRRFSFLLCCLLYFSSQPSPLFFFAIFSFSPLSLRGCQWWLKVAVSATVRWCAVAVERKHGGSCGCSSSLVFFLFLPLSLPVLPRFFVGFPFSPLSPLKTPPFCNISLRSFPAFSSLFFPLFFFVSTFSVPFSLPLSLSKNPSVSLFSVSLLLLLFLLCSGSIYRGKGSGIDLALSHHCTWGTQSSCFITTPGEVANGGVACMTRLLCLLIMRRCGWRLVLVVAEHMRGRGRNKGKKIFFLFPCCTSRGRRRRRNSAT